MRREHTKERINTDIVISSWHFPILIDTKDVRQLLYNIVISGWNRVDVVGFEINLDVSRETLMFQEKP